MFYDETQATTACEEEPSLIFELIILKKKIVSLNTIDQDGNTVLMRLLKSKKYDIVEKYMNDLDSDINHQNKDGNTFTHLLATRNYLHTANIIKKLKRNKEINPNIRNNEGKTILDIAISTGNLCTTLKLLEDKRFNNIDLVSFNNLYNTFIKSDNFGKYTKLTNLETIVNELSKKAKLLPKVKEIVDLVKKNFDIIKNELMNNKLTFMDNIVKNVLMEVTV